MSDHLLRVSAIVGSVVQVGFGAWHFVVPSIYDWFSYVPSIPDELRNAISATNFFLSVCLVLMGVEALVVIVWRWRDRAAVSLTLWVMSGLWSARVIYQVVWPQGTMIPGLAIGMLAIFGLTALSFLIPAILLRRTR